MHTGLCSRKMVGSNLSGCAQIVNYRGGQAVLPVFVVGIAIHNERNRRERYY